jgi:hypothetical protein
VHVPQLVITPPHPSPAGPHWMVEGQGCGVHIPDGGVQHWPDTPQPPHVWPAGHGMQSGVSPPQPSDCTPHVLGYDVHVRGVHMLPPSDELWHRPDTHDSPAPHGQLVVSPPQPSLCWPHTPG